MLIQPRIWCNGSLFAADDPVVHADDHGLVVGDGVFETMATLGRAPFALQRHLDRLRRSAAGLGLDLPASDAELRAAIDSVVASHARYPGELRIRVTVTGGPSPLGSTRGSGPATIIVAAAALGASKDAASVVIVPFRRNERGATAGLKTTSYAENVVALAYALRHGGDEAIFANTAGELCEGTGSNVFVIIGDQILTPPLSSGCLAGVTRSLVIEAGLAVESVLPISALADASEAFLTSTTRWAQPIERVDGRPLAAAGAQTIAVQQFLADLAAKTLDP